MEASSRVTINTGIQYARMIICALLGLYSVRIILNALGTNDYGIYDVIAGVIGLLGFINASLTQTSIRYLSVSLGKKNISSTNKTFNNCFWLHLFLASLLVVVLEIIGVFIFDGFLNIPINRIFSAKVIYHSMIFTLFMNIISTPFKALIISHEEFAYTSFIAILDSCLKLAIAFIITYTASDKLIVYGVLMALISFIDIMFYLVYDILRHKNEIIVSKISVKGVKSVSGFAGWTILDVLGSLMTRQGYAIMLNRFFGPATNAVFAIARQLEGQVYMISSSVIDTMKPQIMVSQGSGEHERMLRLSLTAGKFGFSLMSLIAIPLIILMPEILKLWLVMVPEGTILFSRLLIIACMVEQLTRGLVYANQAIGNIKWFSIIVSSCRMISLPISWFVLHFGFPSHIAIIIFVIFESIGSFSRVLIMSKLTQKNVIFFLENLVLKTILPFVISFLLCYAVYSNILGFLGMVLSSCVSAISYILFFYLFGLIPYEKDIIKRLSYKTIRIRLK